MNSSRTVIPTLLLSLLAPAASGAANFAIIHSFNGSYPIGLTHENGMIYGVSEADVSVGFECGSVFELQPPVAAGDPWAITTLYSFASANDACIPVYAPVFGADGALYGVSATGGSYNDGAVFQLRPPTSPGGAWTERIISELGAPGANIGFDVSPLIPGPGSSFYLLTSGGIHGWGGLLHLTPPSSPDGAWTTRLVYSFPAGTPADSLVAGPNGVLYGTTLYESAAGGLVFQLTPPTPPSKDWTYTVLYNLSSEQGVTLNALTVAADGTIYGTTYGTSSYASGPGTVFSLTPPVSPDGPWAYALLKSFGANHPDQSLIVRDGNLYGAIATAKGGAVFELRPPDVPGGEWTSNFLHGFTDGQVPGVALSGGAFTISSGGMIYGATQNIYSQPADGTVYQIATQ